MAERLRRVSGGGPFPVTMEAPEQGGAEVASRVPEDGLTAVQRVLRRQLSPEARARLLELKEALGLHADDALWSVLGALEHYEQLYETHPKKIREVVETSLAGVRETYELAAKASAQEAQATLAEVVSAAAEKLAARRAVPLALQAYGLTAAVVTVLCGVGLTAGVELGRNGTGPWPAAGALWTGLRAVLSAPAGWLLFVFAVPAAAVRVRRTWRELGEVTGWRKQIPRWLILALWTVAGTASLAVLSRLAVYRG